MSKRICKVIGCSSIHDAKGYCGKHYMQVSRYGKIKKRTTSDPNKIIINGDIAEIVLYNVRSEEVARTLIDAEDVDKVKKYKWRLHQGRVNADMGRKKVGLQHIVLGITPSRDVQIDHRNHNTLDNRKEKLRVCTNKQNSRNRKVNSKNKSGYKGVWRDKGAKKWQAYITVNYHKKHLGMYETKKDAARAYNEAALKYHGEFAKVNLIPKEV